MLGVGGADYRVNRPFGIAQRLLNRSTPSVSPTDAGLRFADRLRPALLAVDHALEDVGDFGHRPSGTLRISASAPAARVLLVDIVDQGFDAGIRLR